MNTVADRDLDVKSCVAGSVQTGVCTNTEIIVPESVGAVDHGDLARSWPYVVLGLLILVFFVFIYFRKHLRHTAICALMSEIESISSEEFENAASAFGRLYEPMSLAVSGGDQAIRRVFHNFAQRGMHLSKSDALKRIFMQVFPKIDSIKDRELINLSRVLLARFKSVGVRQYSECSQIFSDKTYDYYLFDDDETPENGTPYKVVRNAWVMGDRVIEKGEAHVVMT